jgi:hypothetical protein
VIHRKGTRVARRMPHRCPTVGTPVRPDPIRKGCMAASSIMLASLENNMGTCVHGTKSNKTVYTLGRASPPRRRPAAPQTLAAASRRRPSSAARAGRRDSAQPRGRWRCGLVSPPSCWPGQMRPLGPDPAGRPRHGGGAASRSGGASAGSGACAAVAAFSV